MTFRKMMFILKWQSRKIYKKITKKQFKCSRYLGKEIMKVQDANKRIYEAILSNTPYMVARYGASELNLIWRYSRDNKKLDIKLGNSLKQLCAWSGFFPESEDAAKEFTHLMKICSQDLNLVAVWFNDMEDYFIDTYAISPEICTLQGIEPFFSETPWTAALRGKKVLVVHPFKQTILEQYQNNRDKLFLNGDILPDFDLTVIEAVQTIAGNKDDRFKTWFEALEYMYDEITKVEFDVAILGCGAYGFPLASKIKQMGKVAIHLGGATQILFGIRGTRWDNIPEYQAMVNSSWVRPGANERPNDAKKVEGACYW